MLFLNIWFSLCFLAFLSKGWILLAILPPWTHSWKHAFLYVRSWKERDCIYFIFLLSVLTVRICWLISVSSCGGHKETLHLLFSYTFPEAGFMFIYYQNWRQHMWSCFCVYGWIYTDYTCILRKRAYVSSYTS